MRIAVTGAGGFLGRAVVQCLQEQGDWVVPMSRDDLYQPDFKDVETVIHCAALAHRTGAERPDADAFEAVNYRLVVDLALKAKEAGVRRFVFVSTIYTISGNPSPLKPDMPLAPCDDYGRAKAKAEAELLSMSGIEIVIARPVLIYGKGARANLRSLMKLCDTGIPLPFGMAGNQRSFISLENAARALVFLAMAPAEKVSGRAFHLAEPKCRSTRELIFLVRKAQGRPVRLLAVPPIIMRFCLTVLGKKGLYDQLFGDLVADTSSLTAIGFDYLPGDGALAAMARAWRN